MTIRAIRLRQAFRAPLFWAPEFVKQAKHLGPTGRGIDGAQRWAEQPFRSRALAGGSLESAHGARHRESILADVFRDRDRQDR